MQTTTTPTWLIWRRVANDSIDVIVQSMKEHLRALETMPIEYLIQRDLIGADQTREEAVEFQRRAIEEIQP